MARARRAGSRSGRVIENVSWNGFVGDLGGSAGSTAEALLTPVSSGPKTILRTRGEISGFLTGAIVPGDRVHVGVGFQLVPFGTGTTVLREPIADDTSSRWFYHEQFVLAYDEMVTDVVGVEWMTAFRKTIDVKAMRRWGPDEEIQMVVQNATLGTAASVRVSAVGRFLTGN